MLCYCANIYSNIYLENCKIQLISVKKVFFVLSSLLIIVHSVSGQDERMLFKGVPIVNITLLDSKTEVDINREVKFNATMAVTNAGGSTLTAAQLFTGNITIKGRGNWTWGHPKRPYSIVTCDATFKKKNVTLCGMPSESSWCLLADYEDKTALRTLFSSAISYAIGLPWCSRGLKVELYINNEYRGLYTLCEKVERGTNRINITELKTTDNSGDAVTGGYVIEQQTPDQLGPNEASFQDIWGKTFSYKIPDSDKITDQQNSYMSGYWYNFFFKLYNVSWDDTINGYRSVINSTSFAQYYLLEDIAKNGDAYRNSWYMTKDRGKKMDAGPGWDWGIAWGNFNEYRNGISISYPLDTYLPYACPWYSDLLRDPFFSNLVKTTFANAREKINQVVSDVDSYYPRLYATGAISRDSARWPNTFTDPYYWNYFPTYQGHVDHFLSFVKQRVYFQERTLYGLQAARPLHTDLP